jgi:uncharacterized protein YggE
MITFILAEVMTMYLYHRGGYDNHYNQVRNRHSSTYTITVEGEGQITARPDQAKITLGVVTEDRNVLLAQQENATISTHIIQALKDIGIEDSSIRTTVYTIYPKYDYIEGKSVLRGYEVEHLLEVTIKELGMIGKVYDIAVKQGANRTSSIEFIVSNQETYYREALKRALIDAKEKAESISQTVSVHLSRTPIKIKEQRQIQGGKAPRFATQAVSAATQETPPIQTGDFIIEALVSVIYRYH